MAWSRTLHDDRRKARKQSKLTTLDFFAWADDVLGQVSARTPLAEALRYVVRLSRRCSPIQRTGGWMFAGAGADCGGERAAAMYSLLETAKLNGVNPQNWLADVLDRIGQGHPINRLDELLPWHWSIPTST